MVRSAFAAAATVLGMLLLGGLAVPQPPPAEPLVIDVLKLKETVRKPVLLRFTAEQWENAIREAKAVDRLEDKHVVLEAVRAPGGRGAMLIGARCPPGCTPYMQVRMPEKRKGVELTPPPDTVIIPDCDCPPEVHDPGKGKVPSGNTNAPCRLVLRVSHNPVVAKARVVFACEPVSCEKRCVLVVGRPGQGGIIPLGCACQ